MTKPTLPKDPSIFAKKIMDAVIEKLDPGASIKGPSKAPNGDPIEGSKPLQKK